MLQIVIPARPKQEYWDEERERFVYEEAKKECVLQLEHSLISLSKWESKWHKSFLSKKDKKTREETIDYIKCMTLTQNVDPSVYDRITNENVKQINEYISNPMSAAHFPEEPKGKINNEPIIADLIYYWMVTLNIPFTCEKWHLNRLIALIRVCNIKNAPPKKTSARDIMSRNAAINEANKKRFKTRG